MHATASIHIIASHIKWNVAIDFLTQACVLLKYTGPVVTLAFTDF